MSRNIIPVAPGVTIEDARGKANCPSLGVVNLVRQKDGSLIPMLRTWKPWVKLTVDLPEKLGIELSYRTLRTLILAGFVDARAITPRQTLVNVGSLFAHFDNVRDPEFWTPERVRAWEDANALKL